MRWPFWRRHHRNVFIMWSGQRSNDVAIALCSLIEALLPRLELFVSEKDILSGQEWSGSVDERLGETKTGIAVLTDDCLDSTWIHFEAGAIFKGAPNDTSITPYVVGNENLVTYPLRKFQIEPATQDGTRSLLQTLYKRASGMAHLPQGTIKRFDELWPTLDTVIEEVIRTRPQKVPPRWSNEASTLHELGLERVKNDAEAQDVRNNLDAWLLAVCDAAHCKDDQDVFEKLQRMEGYVRTLKKG